MPPGSVVIEVAHHVARITLNRPSVLNSINASMAAELHGAFVACAADRSVRAVLLTGAGRAFCAGQDLAEVARPMDGSPVDLGAIVRRDYAPIVRVIRAIEKPVVCAVNGVAAGGGAGLALACDLVIASTTAAFVLSFCKVGLVPDCGSTLLLPRVVGLPRAVAMMMLGDTITAAQAAAWGMIHQVCEAPALLASADALTSRLAAMPTRGLGLTKRAINRSLYNDLEGQLDTEAELQREAGWTTDYTEGVRAFLDKRSPVFKGH